jgi:putative ATP-dependent endonuclease of OLD family
VRLVSITIEDFRSITKAHKIHLYPWTVLIGPNNEGKSNILRALVIGMQVLTSGRTSPFEMTRPPRTDGTIRTFVSKRVYDWDTDFPIQKQNKEPQGTSIIQMEFELTSEEVADFKTEIRSNLNGTLPIRISLGNELATISIAKKGPGAAALTKKAVLIGRFINRRLEYRYIPTIRNANAAGRVVSDMVEEELSAVEQFPEYKKAILQIEALQDPILKRLSASIQSTLTQFLPAIKGVKVSVSSEARARALRRSEIYVNDGTETKLEFKGDGVQSLAAIALMRHASQRGAGSKHVIVAVEEPESHLHPSAIHGLKSVLQDLAKEQQIVITSHCPLFVDRTNIDANVIVNHNKARAAKNIEEIREILGVRASDNLRHAELVLVVEGEEDKIALSAMLPIFSSLLQTALKSGSLVIDTLQGGSNLSYKVGLLQEALCMTHAFLDYDKAGRDAFEKAKLQGLLLDADVNFATREGFVESEFEDLIVPDIYKQMMQTTYRISLDSPKFKSNKKWSERMRENFKLQGKIWNDQVKAEVKHKIALLIASDPSSAVSSHNLPPLHSLANTLAERLGATPEQLQQQKPLKVLTLLGIPEVQAANDTSGE